MGSCPKRWHSLPQSGRGGPKRSAFYHEDMRSCPKRWHSLPQSGRPVRKKLTHARHLEGVRSPSSILFAFWGRPQPSAAQPGPTQPSTASVPIDFGTKIDAELNPICIFLSNPVLPPLGGQFCERGWAKSAGPAPERESDRENTTLSPHEAALSR